MGVCAQLLSKRLGRRCCGLCCAEEYVVDGDQATDGTIEINEVTKKHRDG